MFRLDTDEHGVWWWLGWAATATDHDTGRGPFATEAEAAADMGRWIANVLSAHREFRHNADCG